MFYNLKVQTDSLCLLLNYFFRSTNNTVWIFYKHLIYGFYFLWYFLNNTSFQFLLVLFLIVRVFHVFSIVFHVFSIVGSIFWQTFSVLNILFLLSLNSNTSSLFERSSINEFLVDCSRCICTWFISLDFKINVKIWSI